MPRPKNFTRKLMAYSANGLMDIEIMVHPETDLDSSFQAWDCDCQCFVVIAGWLWSFENIGE